MKIVKFWGGLGNQLFQYALFMALKERNSKVKADISYYSKYVSHNGFEIERIFGLCMDRADIVECFEAGCKNELYYSMNHIKKFIFRIFFNRRMYERSDAISSLKFNDEYKSSRYRYFKGYWTSEKYFKDVSCKLRSSLIFPEFDEKNSILAKNIGENNSVSLHIRRGDYLNKENRIFFNVCTKEYYKNAINYIKKYIDSPQFYVFSNDIEWCRENLDLKDACYVDWNKGENSYRDMQLMSLCKHNIIANSTFSWWGAWLNDNPNKMVLVPAKWFDLPNCSVDDIYPEDWIRIPTK